MNLNRMDKIALIFAFIAIIMLLFSTGILFPMSIIDISISTESYLNEAIAIVSLILLILVAFYTFLKIIIKIKDNFGKKKKF